MTLSVRPILRLSAPLEDDPVVPPADEVWEVDPMAASLETVISAVILFMATILGLPRYRASPLDMRALKVARNCARLNTPWNTPFEDITPVAKIGSMPLPELSAAAAPVSMTFG